MRLAGVSSIDEAQAFADGFRERWNKRFAVAPRQAEDAHRPWSGSSADLAEALARREERTLSKALAFSAGATRYAVKTAGAGLALRGAKVTLLHFLDGTLRVRFKDRDLAFTPFKTLPAPQPLEDDKTLDARLDAVIARNAPSPAGSARKGVDNGLARSGAMGGALRQAVIHPHSTRSPLPEAGHFYLVREGDIYFALTDRERQGCRCRCPIQPGDDRSDGGVRRQAETLRSLVG